MAKKSNKTYYFVTYREPSDGKVISLKANTVSDSSLGLSFIAISDFIFDTTSVVVNPAEEELKKRFEGVKTLHLSIYTIISIEEVGSNHKGLAFKKDKSNLVVLSSEQHQPGEK